MTIYFDYMSLFLCYCLTDYALFSRNIKENHLIFVKTYTMVKVVDLSEYLKSQNCHFTIFLFRALECSIFICLSYDFYCTSTLIWTYCQILLMTSQNKRCSNSFFKVNNGRVCWNSDRMFSKWINLIKAFTC